uniref:TBC1 domain family member 15 n=1 Tax=Clastoptera arizonana TaxID=38151 RepID=A0A1B6CAJ1_9HEMI
MDENNEQGTEVFSHHGVILKNPNHTDDDTSYNGTLSIVHYSYGKCIEWKPIEVSEVSDCADQDWSLVNTVGSRSRTLSNNSVGLDRVQPIKIEIRELKSYRVKKHGRYLNLMQRDGTSHNAFYFQYGNANCFVNAMKAIVRTRRSARDRHLFIVIEERNETQSLNHSFAELNLYPENPSETVWKFMSNLKHRPYETTLETFSKLTDVFLYRQPEQRPEYEVAELLNRSLSSPESDALGTDPEDDYQMIPALPPRPEVKRGAPLSAEQWSAALDDTGKIVFPVKIEQAIFRGGIEPALRCNVWKFLLGYYPWESTTAERAELRKQKVDEYFKMKLQWRSMTLAQEERFSAYRDRKSLIEKDVNRTDRTHPFFEGENNANLALLSDILMTYVMYNFDLGYVQGMSDLLSPILILMSNEVDAFWCFVGLMDRVCTNFDMDQAGMKKQLAQLQSLLGAAEPELGLYLDQHDSSNMFFCFRWLLVLFKREFSNNDIMLLWEVLFTNLPCPNFHLLLCIAILDCEKNILIENKYGFTEILKHVNDLSLKIDVEKIIRRAESIYLQLTATTDLPLVVKRIIGLATPDHTGESSEDDEEVTPNDSSSLDCERVNFVSGTGEVAFERSINLNYH